MSRNPGLQSCVTVPSPRSAVRPLVPVLIRVPALPGASMRPRRPARRRRLRREVRMAGYAVMAAAPLVMALLMLWGGWPKALASDRPALDREAERADFATASHRPVISISIEPAVLSPYAEAEPPIVFPGYLLPADGSEEPAHAGS